MCFSTDGMIFALWIISDVYFAFMFSTLRATNGRDTDERLIRKGERILELSFVENCRAELDAMNHGKEGCPYKLTPTYIHFLTAFRCSTAYPTAS